ncbi:hypothetical protein HAX54_015165 [Datura stramonium]|uniref:Uncharacterized protein n=1 Tax=Datura stramonium TaxID=4076 RepID=A0ABS8RZ76_DATST|nr:hypothetical protein [Datura stramonium]
MAEEFQLRGGNWWENNTSISMNRFDDSGSFSATPTASTSATTSTTTVSNYSSSNWPTETDHVDIKPRNTFLNSVSVSQSSGHDVGGGAMDDVPSSLFPSNLHNPQLPNPTFDEKAKNMGEFRDTNRLSSKKTSNDTIIFTLVDSNFIKMIMHTLKEYENESGQLINMDKSSFYMYKNTVVALVREVEQNNGFVRG